MKRSLAIFTSCYCLLSAYTYATTNTECTVTDEEGNNVTEDWREFDDEGNSVVKCDTLGGCAQLTVSDCDTLECHEKGACFETQVTSTKTVSCDGYFACGETKISGAKVVDCIGTACNRATIETDILSGHGISDCVAVNLFTASYNCLELEGELCSGQKENWEYEEPGICFAIDNDEDSVPDYLDECEGTPLGIPVDEVGCPDLDVDATNELQTLQYDEGLSVIDLVNPDGSIESSIDLAVAVASLSVSSLTLSDSVLELSNSEGKVQTSVDLASLLDGDSDVDSTNELQTLEYDGETSTIALLNKDGTIASSIEMPRLAFNKDKSEIALVNANGVSASAVDLASAVIPFTVAKLTLNDDSVLEWSNADGEVQGSVDLTSLCDSGDDANDVVGRPATSFAILKAEPSVRPSRYRPIRRGSLEFTYGNNNANTVGNLITRRSVLKSIGVLLLNKPSLAEYGVDGMRVWATVSRAAAGSEETTLLNGAVQLGANDRSMVVGDIDLVLDPNDMLTFQASLVDENNNEIWPTTTLIAEVKFDTLEFY